MNKKELEFIHLPDGCIGIILSQNRMAIIDAGDFPLVSDRRWQLKKACGDNLYARASYLINGSRRNVCMHTIIMRPEEGMCIDHIDGNGLNNRRSNLRVATPSENKRNRPAINSAKRYSKYKGVQINPRWEGIENRKKWRAQISVEGKKISLGYYRNEEHAALAFNESAIKYHGEFAHLNIVGEDYVM